MSHVLFNKEQVAPTQKRECRSKGNSEKTREKERERGRRKSEDEHLNGKRKSKMRDKKV